MVHEPVVVVSPEELDAATAPGLRDQVADLFAAGARAVVLDLAPLRFVDSSGIGALIAVAKRAQALEVDLRLRNVGENVATTLRMSGASRVLPLER